MSYLFLVRTPEGWQIATRDGKVVTTTETNHFRGEMPLIVAGDIFLDTVPNEDLMHGVPLV